MAVILALLPLWVTLVQTPQEPYRWRNVEIVGGGFVTGIIFHPKQRDLIYARTDIGGSYRWNPKTRRWVPLLDWLKSPDWNLYGSESIGIDPNDPKRLYIASGTYTNEWAGNGSILRSKDQGRTFERTDMPFKFGGNHDGRSMGERLVVDPQHGNHLLLGTRYEGLWQSQDYGATWSPHPTFPVRKTPNGIGVVFETFVGRQIIVGVADTETPLYRSNDEGKSWEAIPGQPTGFMPHHAVVASDGTLYISFSDGPGPNGVSNGAVYKLDLKSNQWKDISPEKPSAEVKFGYAGLTVDAQNPKHIIVSTIDRWSKHDDAFRSLDGGESWQSLNQTAVMDASKSRFLEWDRKKADFGHWLGDIEIDPFNSNRVLYVTGATIWGTEQLDNYSKAKPTSWTVWAEGLEETAVLALASPPSGPPLFSALGDIGGFRHDDLDQAPSRGLWTNPVINSTGSLDFAELKPSILVRAGAGTAGYSLDGAVTWQPFATLPTKQGGDVAVNADGRVAFFSPGNSGPFRTDDWGATWAESRGVRGPGRITGDRVAANRVLWLTAGGQLSISVDGGLTFEDGPTKLPPQHGKLVAVPGKTGHFWLPTSTGLMRSQDGGRTFSRVGSVENSRSIGFGKAAPGKSYPTLFMVGTLGGLSTVYRSTDEGQTWVRITDPQHEYATMNEITGDPRVFGRAYLGTNGRGILVAEPKSK